MSLGRFHDVSGPSLDLVEGLTSHPRNAHAFLSQRTFDKIILLQWSRVISEPSLAGNGYRSGAVRRVKNR